MVVQILRICFDLKSIESLKHRAFPLIKEIRQDFLLNSSFLIPNFSFRASALQISICLCLYSYLLISSIHLSGGTPSEESLCRIRLRQGLFVFADQHQRIQRRCRVGRRRRSEKIAEGVIELHDASV